MIQKHCTECTNKVHPCDFLPVSYSVLSHGYGHRKAEIKEAPTNQPVLHTTGNIVSRPFYKISESFMSLGQTTVTIKLAYAGNTNLYTFIYPNAHCIINS